MNLEEVIDELKELNEEVPKPLRKPTNQDLERIEEELGLSLHPDYRTFLLAAGHVIYGTSEPTLALPEHPNMYISNIANEAWELGVSRNLIPICEDNGDYYCITPEGTVEFWSHNGRTDESWRSLASWIKEVWIEEG
ncbi:MAG: SMI1/KNR4 family protein [Cyclobacteriaceae bacterium]